MRYFYSLIAAMSVALGLLLVPQGAGAQTDVDVYSMPGRHFVNGRHWNTTCEPYSVTTRCRTEILTGGKWVFNNLTYLPSPRSVWRNNPLAAYGVVGGTAQWTSAEGRLWRSECDTPATGRGGCRSYIWTGGKWVVNNIIRFGTATSQPAKRQPTIIDRECYVVEGPRVTVRVHVSDPDNVGYNLTMTAGTATKVWSGERGTQRFSWFSYQGETDTSTCKATIG